MELCLTQEFRNMVVGARMNILRHRGSNHGPNRKYCKTDLAIELWDRIKRSTRFGKDVISVAIGPVLWK